MIGIKGKKFLHFGVLLLTLTIFLTGVSALEWQNPEDDDSVADDVMFNVSNDADSEFIVFEVEGPNDETINETGVQGEEYVTHEFSAGSGNSGDYTVTAEDQGNNTATIEFLLDRDSPEVEKRDDREFVQHDPELEFTVSDQHTGVIDLIASNDFNDGVEVENGERSNVCGPGGECTESFDIDTDGISQGDTFNIDIYAEDFVGNEFDEAFSYTLDNEYQADTPQFEIDEADENNYVDLVSSVDVDIEISSIGDEESEVQVECMVDGDTVDTTGWDDSTDFSCTLPFDEVENSNVGVQVEACDRAGNCEDSAETFYTFDSEDPEVEEFDTVRDYRVFTDDFMAEYEAYDSASGVDELEYFFEPGTSQGDGNTVEYDGEDEFRVDTALLEENGDQTVYLRARDNVGRWSSIESLDFEYYPDEEPQLQIDAQDDFSVEANDTGFINVVVENTGKLLIDAETIEASSQIFEGENTVEDLEEGDTVNAEFEITPYENQTGLWMMDFSAEAIDASDSVEVLVEANADQREYVDNELETYQEKKNDLQENISVLRESGLNGELNESLQAGTSSFIEAVEDVENLSEEGDYHRALEKVDALDSTYQSAVSTLDEVEGEHRANRLKNTFIMIFLGLSIVAAAAAAFVYTGGKRDLDELELPDLGVELPENNVTEKLEDLREKASDMFQDLKEWMKEEEEEVEDRFEGFR